MQIVKLDAIDSTNAYIKRALREKGMLNNTVVVTDDQYKGRGQMGTSWCTEPGKNLTFSLLRNFDDFLVADQFYLSMLVCLAVHKTLEELNLPDLCIKWPNDILSGNKKLCGVLIETLVAGNKIRSAIIGIGLNVNQTSFPDLAGVSSLKAIKGVRFDLDHVLQLLLIDLKNGFEGLGDTGLESVHAIYENKLFMKNELAAFVLEDGTRKEGSILGVSDSGKLRVKFTNGITEFGFKEVKLIY